MLACAALPFTALARRANTTEARLQQLAEQQTDNKRVFGTVINVQCGSATWKAASGNLGVETSYFIASTTKLYVTAIIMRLRQEGKLQLDDPIANYLPAELMKGLHVYKDKEYSPAVTIRHLLSNTSGIPDYFETKHDGKTSLRTEVSMGKDQHWSFEDAVALSKIMKPGFTPGSKGKGLYSDTNFQLLGKIIELITGMSFTDAVQHIICEPLKLQHTYVYTDTADQKPFHLYYGRKELRIPKAMASFGADGGIVSTAGESMVFLKAFFSGSLFPSSYLKEMQQTWNPIFFPLRYGIGLAKFQLPRLFTMFHTYPALVGHSGLSGAFAYYCPDRDIWITGTVNQVKNPDISYRLMVKILDIVKTGSQ